MKRTLHPIWQREIIPSKYACQNGKIWKFAYFWPKTIALHAGTVHFFVCLFLDGCMWTGLQKVNCDSYLLCLLKQSDTKILNVTSFVLRTRQQRHSLLCFAWNILRKFLFFGFVAEFLFRYFCASTQTMK